MKKYCEDCQKEVETNVIIKKETYFIYGEPIEVDAQILVCSECNEELFNEEYDNATLVKAYNNYRIKHKLLFPDEIRSIREQYGLSQRSFAKLLNWGDKTIYRYENGSLQDKAHNSLLLFLRDPKNMKTYLTENEVILEDKAVKKLLNTVDHLEQNENLQVELRFYDSTFSNKPNEENGYKSFDYTKLCAMVLFFIHKNAELLKTKLMKLLNYSDMIYFKENGISISGLKYIHLPYGPVPDHFDILIGKMAIDHIAHIDVSYESGYEWHHVVADRDMLNGILSNTEIEVLERINDKFKGWGSGEISDYSHKEKGYRSTTQGEIISYEYAKDIQLM